MRKTYAVVKPSVVADNLMNIKKTLDDETLLMAVVKADAYGHGASHIAPVLEKSGADAFAVSSIDEALELREIGIELPVLILGATDGKDVELAVKNNISLTVWYHGQIEEIKEASCKLNKQAAIHIKIDTGMSRLGIRNDDDLYGLLHAIKGAQEVVFEGVFTHFATADEPNSEYFSEQIARFEHALSIIRALGFSPIIHAGNSAVALHHPSIHYDMVRPGYALYGYDPGPGNVGFLSPAMQWVSQIVNLKWVSAGEGVSYGITYHTSGDTLIATVPVGYADGYRRSIGNAGYVLVKGKKAPVIGRVCMDQMMIDVTGISGVHLNDEVILMGSMGSEMISASQMASWQDTIGYEVLCGIGKRVPRFYE